MRTILLHLPAYREPELIPTIKDALANAKFPEAIRFGICRQFCEKDGFDNLDEYRKSLDADLTEGVLEISDFLLVTLDFYLATGKARMRALFCDLILT